MFFDPSDDEAAQLVRALSHYEAVLKTNGTRLLAGLKQLKLHLAARNRQQPLTRDGPLHPVDDEVMLPILIETRDAADALSLSKRVVERLIASGELRSVKIGGSRRVHRQDLIEFAQNLRGEKNAENTEND